LITVLVAAVLMLFISPADAAAKKKKMASPKVAPGKPEIFELKPRGIQRGLTTKVKLVGTNLVGLTEVKLGNQGLEVELLEEPEPTATEAWIEVTPAATLARAAYEVSVSNTNSESSKLKLYVDDLPQGSAEAPPGAGELKLPIGLWGSLEVPGDSDEVTFEAAAGDSLVFELSAKSIGSKANAMLALFDEKGTQVAANNGFDSGDPLLHFKISQSGRYRVRIGERTGAGSKEHFYRLTMGTFPLVIGCFPLGIPAGQTSQVELLGFNLPAEHSVTLQAGEKGEMEVPLTELLRSRKPIKVALEPGPEQVEAEPNDTFAQAASLSYPITIEGRIWSEKATTGADVDLFGFEAKAGQVLVLETEAARRESPVDTRLEVLHADGRPVERLLLQAMRDSHLTFRAIDSVTDDLRVENWQEMELNQLMYLQGEVCKIFRMPQGPDSGFQFYGNKGKRRNYFDTSAIAHALDEATYVVESHPPKTTLVPNGLPIFTVHYENDDDAERELGSDSRLLFTAPADGKYLVRVSDNRGQAGERYAYRLRIRPAKPDFKATLNGADPKVNAGSGKAFSVSVDRIDGFDGDITVELTNVPSGFLVSTPLVVQAGHLEAKASVHAAAEAAATDTNVLSSPIQVTASAMIEGQQVMHPVNSLGKITRIDPPKLYVALEPYDAQVTNFVERSISDKPLEITIAPGQSIPAWLKIKRNGHDDLVTFSVEGLPHGVIVDNIGLNGVLIPKGQHHRQIFLTAAKWVPEIDRLCFAEAKQAEVQASLPLLLHVRKAGAQTARAGE
jgi:hypothetical protein